MGQSIACLVVLAAVLGTALRWDLPARPAPAPVVAAPPVKTKPRVTNKIKVRKTAVLQDNSNSSYASLGLRASFVPAEAPSWMHRAAWRLETVNRSVTLTLKDLARKSILGRVS